MVGQARKSLWIETVLENLSDNTTLVRLVRACGSKPFVADKLQMLKTVRLVRACGSKPNPVGAYAILLLVRLVRACGSKLSCLCLH